MNLALQIEQLVRQHVPLGKRSAKGFEPCRCALCNDYKERAGIKFDAGAISFKCFNCSEKSGWGGIGKPSEKLQNILIAFGVPAEDLQQAISAAALEALRRPDQAAPAGTIVKPAWAPPSEVPSPPGWVLITGGESPWCEVAREYLATTRGLPPDIGELFVTDTPKYEGRLIIPFYYKGKLIYWQGRAMDDTIEPRYANPTVSRDKVIFNYDALLSRDIQLHYVTEGALDALSIGPSAIALTGSSLSDWQLGELQRATKQGKRFVFVIDKDAKDKNGLKLGLKALQHGWSVATMPDGIDDSNDCRKKLGHLWLLNHLATTAESGFAGEVLLKIACR